MTTRIDSVVLEVAGHRLDRWSSYRVDSNLMTPADGFWFQVEIPIEDRQAIQDRVQPGARVKLYLERREEDGSSRRSLQMTGFIDSRSRKVTKAGGLNLTIEGRDLAGLLVDSDIEPWLITETSTRFIDVARKAVERYRIEVIADDSAERSILTGERQRHRRTALERREARAAGVPASRYSRAAAARARAAGEPLDAHLGVAADSGARFAGGITPSEIERLRVNDARPHIGEKVWEYLARHAQRLGLMMWMTADGKLVIGAPDYGQEPLYRLIRRHRSDPADPNTIIEGGANESLRNRYSHVTVYGHSSGQDEQRTRVREITIDPDWPEAARFDRPRFVRDNGARTAEAAAARGLRELMAGKAESLRLSYVLDGHGQSGALFAQGTMAFVDDEPLGIRDNFFVIGRTFRGDRDSGTTTALELIQRGSIEL